MWAYAFVSSALLSGALAFWTLARSGAVPASRLLPGAVSLSVVAVGYVGASMAIAHRLPGLSASQARQRVLLLAGAGIFLASMALSLR
jgi:hypothetical protein